MQGEIRQGRDHPADASVDRVPGNIAVVPVEPLAKTMNKSGSHGSLASMPEDLGKRQALDNARMVEANPTPKVGCLGHVFFTWMDSLVRLGYNRNKADENLQHADLWELPENLRAGHVIDRFEVLWAEEQAAAQAAGRKARLGNAFYQLVKHWVMASAAFELLRMASQYASPLVVRYLVVYLQEPSPDVKEGVFLVALLVLGSIFVAMGKSHAFHKALSAGLVMKAACNGLVYRKVMRLSPSARQEYSSGYIVNLMATDSERMFQSFMSVNALWAAPLGLIISLTLMYNSVKNATWFCLIALFVVFFMLLPVVLLQSKLERLRLECMDVRVKVLNEMMQGIKVIKLMGWELPILETVDEAREKELVHVRNKAIVKALFIALVLGSSVIASVVTFSVYVAMYPEEGMNPENIFVAAILITMLRWPLMQIPEAINAYVVIQTSFVRMQELLESEEIAPVDVRPVQALQEGEPVLSIANGSFVWELEKTPEQLEKEAKKKAEEAKKKAKEKEAKTKSKKAGGELGDVAAGTDAAPDADDAPYVWGGPTLTDINISLQKGELVMVTGRVGSGKSSLLAALLGEINKLSGTVTRAGHVAYVPQSCWIRNASLKDNVTFSTPYDAAKFDATLRACALDTDIKILPAGAETEIGERGINLSGGQKARVQLARAVYCGADIFLLDDPLSAVDTHVARRLMDECLLGVLRHTTRVLVTHQIQFLTHADRIVVVDDGKIVAQGKLDDVKDHIDLNMLHDVTDEEHAQNAAEASAEDDKAAAAPEKGTEQSALVTEEERDKGAVGFEVYMMYFRAWGSGAWGSGVQVLVLVLLFIIAQACAEGTEIWLAWWSMDVTRAMAVEKGKSLGDEPAGPPIKDINGRSKDFWNWIYVGLALGGVILNACRGIYFQTRGVVASRRMVKNLASRVLGGTMAFFDVTPSGRILNRFSADTDRLDDKLTSIFENYLGISAWIFGALAVVCALLPWFTLPFVPLCLVYKLTEMYFTPTARELQRLEAVSRSPMVSHFTETVAGVTTIRAFEMVRLFEQRAIDFLDVNLRPVQLGQESRRWLDQRLEVLNVLVQFFTAMFCLISKDSISPTYAALALYKALSISAILSFLVMMRTFLETGMNAVERINFYTNEIDQEDQTVPGLQAASLAAEWPRTGLIEFKRYNMRYRPNLPLVLRDLTLTIASGEKVGIVGRTGSGKSSMLTALFRLVEAAQGQILIDGTDIAAVPLKTLRSALSIIPQDPVLFSGTLRYNLDPFNQYPDAEVHDVLKCAQLQDLGGLDKEISEGGENLSMGQRQLVALARVLLRKPRVLMLDEATASVDMETDNHIQNIIKERILARGDATLLVIAHRLSTIVDSSRVLVMEQGEAAEYAAPKELLSDKSSILSHMVDKMGPHAAAGLRAQCGVVGEA